MKKVLLVSVGFILACSGVTAQIDKSLNPLITGVPSLSIAPDARAGGMGDVGVATTPDANSQYWNPAKYPFVESGAGFSLSYTPWLRKLVSDINLAYLAGYYKIGEQQAVSASLRYFSLGEVPLTNNQGDVTNTYKPSEFSIDVAYSRMLSEKWSAAVALRYIHSDLSGGVVENMWPGNAFAADVAAYYHTPVTMANGDGNFSLGINISNIGSKISYDKGNTNLFIPTNLRVGVSYDYPIDNFNTISFSGDVNKLLIPARDTTQTDEEYGSTSPISGIFKSFGDKNFVQRLQFSVGAEYAYNKQFFVRGGYFYESQLNGNRRYFTLGAGFKMNVFRLDAAYVIATSQTNPLDQTLRFTLAFDLDGIKNLLQ
jgi:hypothetical protein